jgi:arginyl-tRNA synthetase
MKKEVVKLLKKALKAKKIKLSEEKIESMIEVPTNSELGDYAFPCFSLAQEMKTMPSEIALEIREKIGNIPEKYFNEVETKGPYVNFFVNHKEQVYEALKEILKKREKFGKSNLGKRKTILVEFSSPNIAKSFGIGHIRSTIIGNSIANLCEFQGFTTKRINYLGDWGSQFGQLIFGYKKFGNEKKFKKDSLGHLQEIYVKVNKNKKYIEKSKEEFRKLEEGDRENLALWRRFKELSFSEFEKIYDLFGIEFDEYSSEFSTNKYLEKTLKELKEKKLAKKSQGALVVHLKKYNLGTAIIQKSDGTSIYCVRDLAEAKRRYKKYKFEKMIYEVGQEQNLHFKQVFKILELMGYEWSKNCVHVGHGLYLGKDRKRFSTRKGKTADLNEIIDVTQEYAKKEISKRFPKLKQKELKERALKIALASIFYGDLKSKRETNIVFNPKKFVSFEGNTGPYILYSYARASSIIKKAKTKEKFSVPKKLEDKERDLFKNLTEFPLIAAKAFENYDPSIIASYVYSLCKIFNEFYHAHPVIGSEEEPFRLALIESFRQILRNSCNLLGIKLLEEM